MTTMVNIAVVANGIVKISASAGTTYHLIQTDHKKPAQDFIAKRVLNDLHLYSASQNATVDILDFYTYCGQNEHERILVLLDTETTIGVTTQSITTSGVVSGDVKDSQPALCYTVDVPKTEHTSFSVLKTSLMGALGFASLGVMIKSQQYASRDLSAAPTVYEPPIANADTATTKEHEPINIDVLANDTSSATHLMLTESHVVSGQGTVAIANNQLVFTPSAAYNNLSLAQTATVVVDYQVVDAVGHTASSTVSITIVGTNEAPVAHDDSAYLVMNDTTSKGTPITGDHSLANGLGGSAGFGETLLALSDDDSSGLIDVTSVFSEGLNFFGTTYTSLYINNNGNVSFKKPLEEYIPSQITSATNPFIAPFWADVDTRAGSTVATAGGHSTGANRVWYDFDVTHHVFTVTWDDVGAYFGKNAALNAFQLQIYDRGSGDFDIVYRYEDINWVIADDAHLQNGVIRPAQIAHAGWSSGNGHDFYELPQSGSATMATLDTIVGNTGTAGVWQFASRSGTVVGAHAISIDVLHNDTDGDMQDILFVTAPSVLSGQGSVSVVNNQLVYTPSPDFVLNKDEQTQVVLQYTATDNHQAISNVATVALTLVGGGYAHYVIGDNGNNKLLTTAQSDYILGGSGADIFYITSSGKDVIGDFSASQDQLNLATIFVGSTFSAVMQHATQVGANTVFDFGAGNTLTINNTTLDALNTSNLIL